MQACIRLSLLSRSFVLDVTGFVPKLVVTTITGTEPGELATKLTELTGSQSLSEQQSGSYQECAYAAPEKKITINKANAANEFRLRPARSRIGTSCKAALHADSAQSVDLGAP